MTHVVGLAFVVRPVMRLQDIREVGSCLWTSSFDPGMGVFRRFGEEAAIRSHNIVEFRIS